jgi:hypothetical protein
MRALAAATISDSAAEMRARRSNFTPLVKRAS